MTNLRQDTESPSTRSQNSGPHGPFVNAAIGAASTNLSAVSQRATGAPLITPRAANRRSEAGRSGASLEILAARRVFKSYQKANVEIPVLRGVDLDVRREEFLAIVGQSGSGKSTLLHVLATLDAPDDGEIHFDQNRIDNLPDSGRDLLRNRQFGMIFQFYHLLPELTTLENALAPLMITHGFWSYRARRREFRDTATKLLEMVGLGHRLKHKPCELSGGEMQRAAIARALIAEPRVLFADEPTGNLDRENGEEILRILRTLNDQHGLTIVMVTHDQSIADRADRTVRLVQGRVQAA